MRNVPTSHAEASKQDAVQNAQRQRKDVFMPKKANSQKSPKGHWHGNEIMREKEKKGKLALVPSLADSPTEAMPSPMLVFTEASPADTLATDGSPRAMRLIAANWCDRFLASPPPWRLRLEPPPEVGLLPVKSSLVALARAMSLRASEVGDDILLALLGRANVVSSKIPLISNADTQLWIYIDRSLPRLFNLLAGTALPPWILSRN